MSTLTHFTRAIMSREPAMFLAVVQAFVVLLVTFGVDLTDAQQGAVLGFSAVVIGLVTRSRVTPGDTAD
jgi:Na+/proline symporter